MPFFFFAGILLAVADWIATARDARGIRWVTKPGALLSLLLWFTTSTPSSTPPQVIWFTLALCFSLIGDIFIHMEGYQLVKGGLAFILAHIAFIISYNIPLLIPPASLLIFATNIVLTLVLFRRIIEAIRSMGDTDLAIGAGF